MIFTTDMQQERCPNHVTGKKIHTEQSLANRSGQNRGLLVNRRLQEQKPLLNMPKTNYDYSLLQYDTV
jgi:hypothetical protein